MRKVSKEEYLEFLKTHKEVVVEGKPVKLVNWGEIPLLQPQDFKLENTTVWSFENRGKWATHRGDYRGNWAPEIPRNLILRYTEPGETVLDQMVGSGTTLIESKLLGRRGIGMDINLESVILSWNRVDFAYKENSCEQELFLGDARELDLIEDESIDLVATHPPYASIIPYSKKEQYKGDLSKVSSISEFTDNMKQVATESFRVLKPGKICAILIGDTHRHKHYVPIAFRVLEKFLDAGFILKEDVIKKQWHTETMRGRWRESGKYDFLLTFHEHLFILRKPHKEEKLSKFKDSMKWWN